MQTESLTGLDFVCGNDLARIGEAAKNAEAPAACFRNLLRLIIRLLTLRSSPPRCSVYESARFMYSKAVRVPSVGSAVSGSYSMLATYLNLSFFSSFIVSTIGVAP